MITPAQRTALELASNGLTVAEIADSMGISVRTVEHHLSEARRRLGAKNTTHCVASAIRLNIIKLLLLVCCMNAVSMNYPVDMRLPVRTRTTHNTHNTHSD
jgi:DNA-binding CsgD family transcriptional regulator